MNEAADPKLCRNCLRYRAFRPLTQRLIRDLGSEEVQLINELTRMMPEERQKQDAEANQLRELVRQEERDEWRIRPEMMNYCGLREDQEIYYVAELKNRAGNCNDHKPPEGPPRECATCKHRVTGGGPARDKAHLAQLTQLSVDAAALGQGGGMGQLDEYRNFIGMSKTLEAAQAFYARKLTHQPPDYLPICGKRSDATNFIPCAVQNPHDTCADWEARNAVQSTSPADGWELLAAASKRQAN